MVDHLVEALRYKVPVSIPGIVLGNFQVTSFFRPDSEALGVHSASNRYFLGGIKCVELTAVPS